MKIEYNNRVVKLIRKVSFRILSLFVPELIFLKKIRNISNGIIEESNIEDPVKLNAPFYIHQTSIGKYTYVSQNANISFCDIGRFCSIGPNLFCGWGIHPTHGISTAPMFYSTKKQNGLSLSNADKIIERKKIIIGNDVFIGMNVTILDGVVIGDGCIIGAGAVVSKDIPPYSIAVGCPIKVIKKRFTDEQIEKFLEIKWWTFTNEQLEEIEKYFFQTEDFLNKYYNN